MPTHLSILLGNTLTAHNLLDYGAITLIMRFISTKSGVYYAHKTAERPDYLPPVLEHRIIAPYLSFTHLFFRRLLDK